MTPSCARACSSGGSWPARTPSIVASHAASHRRSTYAAFFEAKALEQQQRHLRHQDTAYNLEPNLKESPGGMRDLQTILWIASAAGLGETWRELAAHGLMTAGRGARDSLRHERLLDDLRIRLHYLTGRREDRLVFDVQTALARELGFADTADAPRLRAIDAALLPRGEVDSPAQRHPAAEPARAAIPGGSQRACRSTRSFRRSTSCST